LIPVSVVIPTHNRANVLIRALESVLSQSLQAAEIVIVDDGSNDNTAEMLANISHKGTPAVRYHPLPICRGVSHARNTGIALARHPWLALLDSDDTWMPDKLACQWQRVLDRPSLRFCHTDELWIRHGKRVNPMKKHEKKGGFIFEHCLPMCRISPSSVLMHRWVVDQFGGFDEQLPACEDYDLWLRICAHMAVDFIPCKLITKYGGHDDQLSSRFWGMDRFRIQSLVNLLLGGKLDNAQRTAAMAELQHKTAIYINGLQKRAKHQEAARIRGMVNQVATTA